jgi:hypothetical protein
MQVGHKNNFAVFLEQGAFQINILYGENIGFDLPGVQESSACAGRTQKQNFLNRSNCITR